MRIFGIAGMLLALAVVAYLVVSYVNQGSELQKTLQAVPGAPTTSGPVDPTKRGLEQRLAPVLDQERQRVEETNTAGDH